MAPRKLYTRTHTHVHTHDCVRTRSPPFTQPPPFPSRRGRRTHRACGGDGAGPAPQTETRREHLCPGVRGWGGGGGDQRDYWIYFYRWRGI